MSCRVACQPEPRRHWPIFSPADLPAGYAECLVCRDWITAVDLFEGVCAGPTTEGVSGGRTHDGHTASGAERPIDGSPVTVAPLSAKHSDQLNALRSVDVSAVQAEGSCFESRELGHLDPVTASPGRSESATGHAFVDARDLDRERTLGEIRRCAEHQW